MTSDSASRADKASRKAKQVKFRVSLALPTVLDNGDDDASDTASNATEPAEAPLGEQLSLDELPRMQYNPLPWTPAPTEHAEDIDGPQSSKSWIRDDSFSEQASDIRAATALSHEDSDPSYRDDLAPVSSSISGQEIPNTTPVERPTPKQVKIPPPIVVARPRSETSATYPWSRPSAEELEAISPFLKFEHEAEEQNFRQSLGIIADAPDPMSSGHFRSSSDPERDAHDCSKCCHHDTPTELGLLLERLLHQNQDNRSKHRRTSSQSSMERLSKGETERKKRKSRLSFMRKSNSSTWS